MLTNYRTNGNMAKWHVLGHIKQLSITGNFSQPCPVFLRVSTPIVSLLIKGKNPLNIIVLVSGSQLGDIFLCSHDLMFPRISVLANKYLYIFTF